MPQVRDQRMPREIWVLVSAAFIIALGFGLISPLLPQYIQLFDATVMMGSIVIASFSIMRLLWAPVSGKLVDRFSFRPVYVAGLLIVALSTMLLAVAQSYNQLLVFRAIGGIGSTMFTVSAMGLIVRLAPPHMRGRASALYGGAFLTGSVLGPVLGAALSGLGYRWPFVIYGIGLLIAAVVVWVGLRPTTAEAEAELTEPRPAMSVREALLDPAYRAALVGGFANGWSNFGVRVAIVPLLAASLFHSDGAIAGLALAVFALGNVIALQFSGRISDRYGRKPIITTGLIVSGMFTATLGFTTSIAMLLVVSFLAGTGAGMINAPLQAVVADVISSDRAGGKVVSTYQMALDLGSISGPILVGAVVDASGFKFGFLMGGIVSLIAAVVWSQTRETLPSKCSMEKLSEKEKVGV
ncbi:MFS transporter [Corynebacterium ulceribovis]|uniref:MFS transporter n=1 Tax=Corynebacterium ulceribovis TaxID=487732 RepID=UPI00035FEFBD|nr:MFS transporter [Corynebacterium ulceribovis]